MTNPPRTPPDHAADSMRPHFRWFVVALSLLVARCLLATDLLAEDPSADSTPAAAGYWDWRLPSVVLSGVAVPEVGLQFVDGDGQLLNTLSGEIEVTGLEQLTAEGNRRTRFKVKQGQWSATTNRRTGQRVLISAPNLTVRWVSVRSVDETAIAKAKTADLGRASVRIIPAWMSLLPPLLAIGLAIWFREIVSALFLAVVVGVCLTTALWWLGPLRTIDTLLVNVLTDADHLQVILFTLFVGATVGVMAGSGGTAAVVARLVRRVEKRSHGQGLTWLLGLFVFFDDYANTMLVGGTMRPVADRLRFSRAKLAFLVDSTAAPVAGLAIISTWVGTELAAVKSGLELVGSNADSALPLLIQSLPYRFYPLLLLFFVAVVAWSGRDFGPMRRIEQRVWNEHRGKATAETGSKQISDSHGDAEPKQVSAPMRFALVPLAVLLLSVTGGLLLTDNSIQVLLLASAASTVAALCMTRLDAVPISRSMGWVTDGMQQMLPAVVVMVLAWMMAVVCSPQALNTSGYLVDGLETVLDIRWLPAATFLLAAATAFATGTSFGTMGLLLPMAIVLAHQLLQSGHSSTNVDAAAVIMHPLFLATVSSVLAGSIFGDHCSPISDTTVLSSAATGCDHLEHVATQIPYAVAVAAVSVLCGLIPLGFGISPWILLPVSCIVLYGLLRMLGRVPSNDDVIAG